MSGRGEFTVRVKEELAAAAGRPRRAPRPAGRPAPLRRHPPHRRHAGPRYTLVLAAGSGGVTRLAFWLLHTGYGVRPDVRVREAGALAPRPRYELVLADRVERVLTDSGVLDGAGRLSFGVAGGLVPGREAAACFARGRSWAAARSRPRPAPHLEIGAPGAHRRRPGRHPGPPRPARPDRGARPRRAPGGGQGRRGDRPGPAGHGAQTAYLAWEDGRIRREVRREAVRLANADHANLRRSVAAAMAQVAVEQAVAGWAGRPARRPGRDRRPAPGPSGRQPGRTRGYARPAALQGRCAGASPEDRGVDGTPFG